MLLLLNPSIKLVIKDGAEPTTAIANRRAAARTGGRELLHLA